MVNEATLGSLSLRPVALPLRNLRPRITPTPLRGATEVNGQFLGRDFNPLDNVPFTAYVASHLILLDDLSKSGYNLARINYKIIFAPESVEDFKRLSARDRAIVRDTIGRHLSHEPVKTSRSRIKRLQGISRPQYRLLVGEIRVFYDVVEAAVEILAIVPKSKAAAWLKELGEKE